MKSILTLTMVAAFVVAPVAYADISESEYRELREQLAAISARLEEVAAENAELRAAQAQSDATLSEVQTTVADMPEGGESWADRVSLSGDFRLRQEGIDPEGGSDRDRTRIRARLNVGAKISDSLSAGFGLATGSSDPISSNQTLGSGGSSKGVVLNTAFVSWDASDNANVVFGKFKNPFTRVGGQPLMWDGDWTPEGVAVKYSSGNLFVNGLATFIESDTRRPNDVLAWGAQVGASTTLGEVKVKGGIGYYSIPTQGNATNFGDAADPGDYFGNTAIEAVGGAACGTNAAAACVYANDYNLTQLFGEASFALGEWPTTVFLDYVKNGDASANDTAWTLGTKIGAAKDRGQMQFTYFYAEKEADSVFGLLTDSDFGGGGTDSKGHWLQLNVGVTKSWTIGAQFFINEVDIASGSKSDYNRFMIDSQWKWK